MAWPRLIVVREAVLVLSKEDALMMQSVFNRALNTWDPHDRPVGALEVADKIEAIIAEEETTPQ